MNRNHFGDIRVFVEVARRGGFRAAAEHLQQAPASVSEAVQRFEERLGVRLFERSTRSVALTAIGEQFYQRSLPAVTELEGAVSDIDDQKDEVSGVLRLSAPYSAGPFFLDELIARFAATYPAVDVELIYDDQKVDLLTSGIDATIRSNTLLEPDTHAVQVGPELNMSIVATRGYIERKGMPKEPRDILNHDTICYVFGRSGQLAPWSFKGPDGGYVIQPNPRLVANDMRSLLHYAAHGLGLAYAYAEIAAPYLANEDMVAVLAKNLAPFPRYSINYRSKKHMTRRLRAFLDLAKEGSHVQ
ncbi:LysR family transcriptional regulator [uncultured Tateyamaria sp.]|uniref:LysR family transcriptional regulator n=1 Tax=uncultured Tateyamaria sp. TaxID=455651 RepID=UPI00263330FA|nr:LysR family transcriptional regulator [uncultured Tateyamaria sp.]